MKNDTKESGAEPERSANATANPGNRGMPPVPPSLIVTDGQIVSVNGLTYQIVDLEAEHIQLRRVTCEFFSDGRVRRFVYGGDQNFP